MFLRILTALFITLSFVSAETPEEKGLAIMKEAKKRIQGFSDFTNKSIMTLKDRNGNESKRFMRSKNLEMKNDGDKILIIFDQPRDVKGTALLTYTHRTEDDDQWLYLPALKRVKRISSSNKSGPFMGSEFAYEDITSEEVEKYTYKYIRDETFDDQECFMVERYPVDKRSGYSKQIVWLDKVNYNPLQTHFFDRKGQLLKVLHMKGYKLYIDKIWKPTTLHMVNKVNGKESTLEFSDFEFKTGLSERDFDKNSLKRAR
ncbi:MAG: outer membrane lipoprotein-sorting protein [Lentisphaeraceae bacterium]|nr:outer membrane lipoprotein-sorting protein [Lentisphaeraceae bacterium]